MAKPKTKTKQRTKNKQTNKKRLKILARQHKFLALRWQFLGTALAIYDV